MTLCDWRYVRRVRLLQKRLAFRGSLPAAMQARRGRKTLGHRKAQRCTMMSQM